MYKIDIIDIKEKLLINDNEWSTINENEIISKEDNRYRVKLLLPSQTQGKNLLHVKCYTKCCKRVDKKTVF